MLEMFVLNPPRGRFRRNTSVESLQEEMGYSKAQAQAHMRRLKAMGHMSTGAKRKRKIGSMKPKARKKKVKKRFPAARPRLGPKPTIAEIRGLRAYGGGVVGGRPKKKRKRTTAAKKGGVRKTARPKKKAVKRKTAVRKPAARKKGGVRKTARKKKGTGRGWTNDTRGHQIAYAIGRSGMGGTRGAGLKQRRKRRRRLGKAYGRGALRRHRGAHPLKYKRGGKRLRRLTPGIPIRYKTKKRRYTLVANRDNRGRFSTTRRKKRRRTTRKGMRRSTARRAYRRNPRGTRKGMRRRTARRAYRRNPDIAASFVDALTAPFDVKFVTETALPVTGGFLLSRFASGMLGGGLMGEGYKGPVRIVGNFAAAGITGFAAGLVASTLKVGNPVQIRGNVILGGMVNAVAGLIKYVLTDVMPVKFISDSPALSSAFGLSGLGYDNSQIRSAVQREVMRELGVSDYLTSQDLGKAQYMGDYLTTQQLAKAQPNTMSHYESNGGTLADFSDVAAF